MKRGRKRERKNKDAFLACLSICVTRNKLPLSYKVLTIHLFLFLPNNLNKTHLYLQFPYPSILLDQTCLFPFFDIKKIRNIFIITFIQENENIKKYKTGNCNNVQCSWKREKSHIKKRKERRSKRRETPRFPVACFPLVPSLLLRLLSTTGIHKFSFQRKKEKEIFLFSLFSLLFLRFSVESRRLILFTSEPLAIIQQYYPRVNGEM